MAGPRVSPRTQKQRSHARSSTAPSTGDDDGPKPPPFLARLYELVNDPATDKVCSWTETVRMDVPGCVADLPNAFTVHDNRALEKDIIPKHYKHSNFTSFIRQLNQYKFRKLEAKKWTFGHENFVKGRPDLLIHIHRNKKTRPSGTTKREGAAEQSNKLLRNRNDLAHQVSTLTATVQQMAERQRVMEAVLSRISGQVLGTDIIPGLPPMRFPPELAPQPKQNGTKPLLMTGEPTETTMRFNTATQKRQRVASQNQGYSGSGPSSSGSFSGSHNFPFASAGLSFGYSHFPRPKSEPVLNSAMVANSRPSPGSSMSSSTDSTSSTSTSSYAAPASAPAGTNFGASDLMPEMEDADLDPGSDEANDFLAGSETGLLTTLLDGPAPGLPVDVLPIGVMPGEVVPQTDNNL